MASVPSVGDTQALFCATVVDELVRHGVRDVVICPGSRSTPLAVAFARRSEITVHIRIDERSASFFALGLIRHGARPVPLLVTSGTAAAELHAAVAEAAQSTLPLLVMTADRPPELHHVGAPQTMPQDRLFGDTVRHVEVPGVARPEAAASWRPMAARWCERAHGGPVHVNLAFIEPLAVFTDATVPGRPDGAPWRRVHPTTGASTLPLDGQRILVVAGMGSEALGEICESAGLALLGDATVQGGVVYADGLLRQDAFAQRMKPDAVIRLGGAPASKILAQRLREWHVPVYVDDTVHPVSDPDGVVTDVVSFLRVASLRGDRTYRDEWIAAQDRCATQFVGLDFRAGALTETSAARTVVRIANEQQRPLMIGSSMPIREVEWYGPARTVPTYANRGVNGIDGVVSTAMGVATVSETGAIALVGDLTFLHDVSALVDPPSRPLTVVVIDNRGGHIFDFLPQRDALDDSLYATLFTTSRPLDLSAVARGFGCRALEANTVGELEDALRTTATMPGVTVVVARPSAPTSSVDFHAWLQRSCARVVNELYPC